MNQLFSKIIWNELARDMKVAVDKVYSPLSVECVPMPEERIIDYYPPFYLEDKCNEQLFGVMLMCDKHQPPQYPLKCKSEIYKEEFVVQSPEDWENHVDKFVTWRPQIQELLRKIKSG